jgi:tryptophan synthase alpha chain
MKKTSNRLQTILARRKAAKQKCFVAYLTAGDPHLNETPALVAALVAGGADIVELGIPFSDPLADGPTNQKAAERALASGSTLAKILEAIPEIRKTCPDTPLVIFSYLNPIYAMGFEKFSKKAASSGADAVLIVDLPPEEAGSYRELLQNEGLDTIFLASPTSDEARLKIIDQQSTGFVYYVSRTGVTGTQSELSASLEAETALLQKTLKNPVMVGFGISNGAQAVAAGRHADGIVIGSAIVKLIETIPSSSERSARLKAFAADIRQALDKGEAPKK